MLRRSISSGTLGIRLLQVDKEMPGASWVEIPKSTFAIRRNSEKDSRCQIEVDVFFNYMKSHPCEGEWNKVAPLRILSFDIECAGRKGHFPEVRQVLTTRVLSCPFSKHEGVHHSVAPPQAFRGGQFLQHISSVWHAFVCPIGDGVVRCL